MREIPLTKEQSEDLTAQISMYISANAPVFKSPAEGPEECRRWIKMNAAGLPVPPFSNDPERDAVMAAFVKKTGLDRTADCAFLAKLFASARRYSWSEFNEPSYFRKVRVPTVERGRFTLTESCYEPFELFQYDMPAMGDSIVVPKIGYCTERVCFPSVYEGDMPWMSACPSEINSMKQDIEDAHGKVLTLGLGLGYFPFAASEKPEVESVTVVELSEEVIGLFNEYLLPQYPHGGKIKVVHADAHEYMKTVKNGEFDYCFADIWESQVDGAGHYKRIRPYEQKLPETEFRYWVRDAIEWFIEQE